MTCLNWPPPPASALAAGASHGMLVRPDTNGLRGTKPGPASGATNRPTRRRRQSPPFLLSFAIGAVAGTVYTLARIAVDDRVVAAIIAALVLVSFAPLAATPARRG